MSTLEEPSLRPEEFFRLYRGDRGYRTVPRKWIWVTMADVFNDDIAYALCPPDYPETFAQTRHITVEDEERAAQFFTMAVDMEPQYGTQLRWVFAYSYADPDFLEAVRRFPLVFDHFSNEATRTSRIWMSGDYMAKSLMYLEGIPADYAYAVHPRREPVLLYP